MELTIKGWALVKGTAEGLALVSSEPLSFWGGYDFHTGEIIDRRQRFISITKGAAFTPILNAMGIALQTMGNAISLPYGPQAMKAYAARAAFPVLAANCRDGDGPLPEGLHEYVLLDLPGGHKLGVTGFTAPWGNAYEVFGLHFPDFIQLAKDLVVKLRQQGATVIAVLSHLGLEDDRRLAAAVPEIDVIVGAHSHTLLPDGEISNGVLIAQAGDYAQALGRVSLVLDMATGRVLTKAAEVLDVPPAEPPDPPVEAAIQAAKSEADLLMARPICKLESPLNLDYYQECDLGNLAADILRLRMQAGAAILAGGHFHAGLAAGTLTIIAALERGLDPAVNQYEHHGFRGTPIGIPQISGLRVWFDPGANAGQRIIQVEIGGKKINPGQTYRLAHTDAEIASEWGYLQLEPEQETFHEVPTILREAIEDYLRLNPPRTPPAGPRWIQTRSSPAAR